MVIFKNIPAGFRNRMQLMVRQEPAEDAAGGGAGVAEFIIGIIHLIHAENRLQAALVEAAVVRHQRQPLDHRRHLRPYFREHRSVLRILRTQTVHAAAEPLVIFRLRTDETVELVDYLPSPYDHHPDRAHAAAALVGGLEIYGGEIGHVRTAKICNWGRKFKGMAMYIRDEEELPLKSNYIMKFGRNYVLSLA